MDCQNLFACFSCLLLAVGLSGCNGSSYEDEKMLLKIEEERLELQEALVILEEMIATERSALREAQDRHGEAAREAELVRRLSASLRVDMQWLGGSPGVTGELENNSGLSLSSVSLLVTQIGRPNGAREERLNLVFDPILLPEARAPITLQASPYVWGFQAGEFSGDYRFVIESIGLAGGGMIRDDFAAMKAREADLRRREERVTRLRLDHGEVYTRLTALSR